MRKFTIIIALLIALVAVGEISAKRPKRGKKPHKTHRVAKHKKTSKRKVVKRIVPIDPRLDDPNYDPFLLERTPRWRMCI